ncbi:hypothetical protein GCM10009850_072260 [Nonomuraea monospora]|uniref:Uncharacterized protein n=1 Tax=Nonomuraea monospora TaxID=568818 RepID=A0ABP5PJ58_9ACTN
MARDGRHEDLPAGAEDEDGPVGELQVVGGSGGEQERTDHAEPRCGRHGMAVACSGVVRLGRVEGVLCQQVGDDQVGDDQVGEHGADVMIAAGGLRSSRCRRG